MDETENSGNLEDFLRKKIAQERRQEVKVDWEERKNKWISAIKDLYDLVDEIIVLKLRDAGYDVKLEKEHMSIIEDYIGSYETQKYIIKTQSFVIQFIPRGSIIIGGYGRVDMFLPKGTVKVILAEWGKWEIVRGLTVSRKLVPFNETSVTSIFKDYL